MSEDVSKSTPRARARGRPRGSLNAGGAAARIRAELLEWVAKGKSIASYLRQPGTCSPTTVQRWRAEFPEWAAELDTAVLSGNETRVDRMRELARTPLYFEDPDADIRHRELQIKVEQWDLERRDPRYGNKHQVQHGGGVQITVTTGVDREPLISGAGEKPM